MGILTSPERFALLTESGLTKLSGSIYDSRCFVRVPPCRIVGSAPPHYQPPNLQGDHVAIAHNDVVRLAMRVAVRLNI
jgi:hypothetical protein